MRIHELAKELNIQSKEIVNFLNDQEGIKKTASNSLNEEEAALVRKKFRGSGAASPLETEKEAPKKKAATKAEEKPAEKPAEKAAEKTADKPQQKPAEKPALKAPEKPEKAPAAKERPKGAPKKDAPGKTYVVINMHNSKSQSGQRNQRNGQGMSGGRRDERRGSFQNGRRPQDPMHRPSPGERPRRPLEKPTSRRLVESAERDRIEREQAEKNRQAAAAAAAAAAAKEEKPEPVKPQEPPKPRRQENTAVPAGERRKKPENTARFTTVNHAQNTSSGQNANKNAGGRNKNAQNRRKDADRFGAKRQENYVNLEKHGNKKKPQHEAKPKEAEDTIRSVILPEHLTIKELSDKLKIQASALIKKLFLKGQMVTVNQEVDYATAEEIALEFNCIAEPEEKIDVIAELLKEEEEDESKLVSRPPVVCVMGHVDHGKTSLLDAIRDSHVTDREAGGITQKIGAYVVSIDGRKITFLDTPGHEAFTAMRMRGASSTDIAILVVAADDGVMPQTVEAINHARAAGIEIIVAVNKIDKPNANIDRVKQELSEHELIPEDWGGSTIFAPVSAHTHEGIDNLLEMVLLTADVLELKANPHRNARGVVIEAQLDKGRGAVATVLVQKGTLKVGQPMACGSAYGKVRAMVDENGRRVKEAGPSTPVEILGLSSVPDAGETFVICDSEKDAHSFADTYVRQDKEKLLEETRRRMSLDDLFSQIQAGNVKELDIIVKADVQGSVEAVKTSLEKLSNEEVVVKVIHGGVGAINESDVILASASGAIIIGFNVRPDPQAKNTAENEGVDIRLYKVIYNAIEDVEAAMKGMLDPVFEEKILGHAEIRQIFKASGIGNIAGSYVLDGTFERGCKCRITREGKEIFDGDLASLKRFKDDVKEVRAGYECGLVFDGFNEIAELDVVEAYKMVEVQR